MNESLNRRTENNEGVLVPLKPLQSQPPAGNRFYDPTAGFLSQYLHSVAAGGSAGSTMQTSQSEELAFSTPPRGEETASVSGFSLSLSVTPSLPPSLCLRWIAPHYWLSSRTRALCFTAGSSSRRREKGKVEVCRWFEETPTDRVEFQQPETAKGVLGHD